MAVIEGTSTLAIYVSSFLATDFGSDQTRRRPGRDQAVWQRLGPRGARCPVLAPDTSSCLSMGRLIER